MTSLITYPPEGVGAHGPTQELERLRVQASLTGEAEVALLRRLVPHARTIVEVGCGSGEFVRVMRQQYGTDTAGVVGLDPDARLLTSAPEGCDLLTDERLDAMRGTADLVVVRFVAQHLTEPARRQLWQRARCLAAPGGVLAVIDVDDGDIGTFTPYLPSVAGIYRKLAAATKQHGLDRNVLPTAMRELREAGWQLVQRHRGTQRIGADGLDDLEIHLGPERHVAHLRAGLLSVPDLSQVYAAWSAFRDAPDPVAELAVHLVVATSSTSGQGAFR